MTSPTSRRASATDQKKNKKRVDRTRRERRRSRGRRTAGHMFLAQMPTCFTYARALASSRHHPEDRAEVLERGDMLLAVVADGAGGMRGGAAASDAFLLAITTAVADPPFDIESEAGWKYVFERIDAELAGRMTGETTGVLMVVSPRGLIGVSAGDSEAWVIGAMNIDDLTEGKNKKRLGSGRAVPTAFFRPSLDGVLVVGTDGLFKYAAAEKLAAAVRGYAVGEATRRLTTLVQLPSGTYQDDVGVVVVASTK